MSEDIEEITELVQPDFEFILFDSGFAKVEGEIIFWITICNIAKDDESYALFSIQKAFGEWTFDFGFLNIW
jgi:hypothetical protein